MLLPVVMQVRARLTASQALICEADVADVLLVVV
jgi:hypothetical protein